MICSCITAYVPLITLQNRANVYANLDASLKLILSADCGEKKIPLLAGRISISMEPLRVFMASFLIYWLFNGILMS